jgi:transcriptional regulator with PAS, ATPase and Fis domain
MFSKIEKLEKLLTILSSSLQNVETKRYTANQMLKAENINLAEGASLTINMNNMICTQEVVTECLDIVKEIKPCLPVRNKNNFNSALNNYKDILVTKALEKTYGDKRGAANLLGLSYRQLRYQIQREGS